MARENIGSGLTDKLNDLKNFAQRHDVAGKTQTAAKTGARYARAGARAADSALDAALETVPGSTPLFKKHARRTAYGAAGVAAAVILPLPGPNVLYGIGCFVYGMYQLKKSVTSVGKHHEDD